MKSFTVWKIRDGGAGVGLLAAAAIVASCALSALTPGQAVAGTGETAAGTGQNAREARTDRAEIGVDRAQLRNDIGDVRRLERLLLRLDSAQKAGDKAAEERIRTRLHGFLRGETAEARHDLAADRRESARSRQEVRSERREVAGDKRELDKAREDGTEAERLDARRDLAHDRADLRDDRRDRRDDKRDRAASRLRLDRQREILVELRKMEPNLNHGDSSALARERSLYEEFLRISREDAAATGRELREDRRERREDRRERRDDRQESAEPR
jgi:hypothetical protein